MLKEGLCILLRKYHSQRRKRFGKGNHIAGRFLDMVTSAVHLDTATHTDAVMSVCVSTCWPLGGPGLRWLRPLPAFGPPEFALVANGRRMFGPAARGFLIA